MDFKNGTFYTLVIFSFVIILSDAFRIMFDRWWVLPAYIGLTIMLSFVNIPPYKTKKEDDIVNVNAGGGILPILFSVYLLYQIRSVLEPIAITVVIAATAVIVIAWKYSCYAGGQGVGMGGIFVPFIVPFISACAVYLLTLGGISGNVMFVRLSLGFIFGTIAAVVGNDLCHIHKIGKDGVYESKMSMGGVGIFDGVWLFGMLTMMFVVLPTYILGQ